MTRTIVAMLLIAGLGVASLPEPVDAAQARAKAKRTTDSQPSARRVATTQRSDGTYQPIAGVTGVRDRSTYYLPDGRINGREFFEQLQERTSGTGQ